MNATVEQYESLVDGLGRVHTSLRVSVTDRCNIRCFYCMPAENVVFRPREELLSFEEIERFVQVAASIGVVKLRLTGGEPLVRNDIPQLVARLVGVPGIGEVALTTNGILLADQATALKQAGLSRLNVSLDAVTEATFEKITRRRGLEQVIAGIFAARDAGFERIRLNAVAIRGLSEAEIVPLAEFATQNALELRFIEFMPLDAEGNWHNDDVLTGRDVRQMIEAALGPLEPIARTDASQPAVDFRLKHGGGRVGFINSVSEPFCASCNRLRITAEGQVRNCLFSHAEWDARALLRDGRGDNELRSLIRDCVAAKAPAHGIGSESFVKPERAMYQIGG